jgi:hypothetical protein
MPSRIRFYALDVGRSLATAEEITVVERMMVSMPSMSGGA